MPDDGLISRAARFFVLTEQGSRLYYLSNQLFWDMSVPPVVETAAHLPALAATVRTIPPNSCLNAFFITVASLPLPDVLPPEAVPWHNRLVAAWEVHHASNDAELQNIARVALVRLDGFGMPNGQQRRSHLPEWLAEAQKIASGEWKFARSPYLELEALAALAAWRPAPRVITPPETLRRWVDFWLEVGRSDDPMKKGIAAIALLNLPGADLRAASVPPVPTAQLLRQLTTAIEVAAERKDPDYLSMLDWQPVKETSWPVAEVMKVADAWLEVTRHNTSMFRCKGWRQLIRWDRAGSLSICGMDLLPELVQAVPTEEDGWVLWAMAQWLPAAGRLTSTWTPGRRSLLQQLEGVWGRYRTSRYFYESASAWLAGIRLHQAGLAAERTESFLDAYLSNLAKEYDPFDLFILAQWSPGAGMSGMWHRDWNAVWQRRLLDKYERMRETAAWALLRQPLEKEHGRSLRCAALGLWRAGTKVSSEGRDILDAVFARFQQVRARLAAGEVPDFEKQLALYGKRHCPPLALPPGRIVGSEWSMENEELKMENGEWRMKHQEVTVKPNHLLDPNRPSR